MLTTSAFMALLLCVMVVQMPCTSAFSSGPARSTRPGVSMRVGTSWVPGKGLTENAPEDITAKSITNEIMSFYSGNRVNETIIGTRLGEPTVSDKLDGMHIITLLFQSARKRRKIKNVLPVDVVYDKLATWDRAWCERDISTFVYGVRALECLTVEDAKVLKLGASKIKAFKGTLSSRAIGNALYGLADVTAEADGVIELVEALTANLENFDGDLNGQDIGIGLYGMQGLSSDQPSVRKLMSVMAAKIEATETEMDQQAIGNALYGLQSMCSDYAESRQLVSALATKIGESVQDMCAKSVGSAAFGLQRMTSDSYEVRSLLNSLAERIDASAFEMDSQAVGSALYGLQNMKSDVPEVRTLVHALSNKIQSSSSLELDNRGASMALYGMNSMNSDQPQVRTLMTTMTNLIKRSKLKLTGQFVADALYGIRNMNFDCPELRALLAAIADGIDSSVGKLEAIELSNALNGFQGVSSEMYEVRLLASKLADKMQRSKVTLRSQAIGRSLVGLQRFSADSVEVRYLLKQLTRMIKDSNRVRMTSSAIADSMFGLQGMSSASPEVQELLSELAKKISATGATLSADQVGRALFGLQGLSSDGSIFQDSAIGLDVDEVQFLVSALWDKVKVNTDFMPLSAIALGLQGITLLKDPISENIRQYLYAQSIRAGSEEGIVHLGAPADVDLVSAVRGMRLNGLRVPTWMADEYERIEKAHDEGHPVIPMSRADKLVTQKYIAKHPGNLMRPNSILDGFKLDMHFPDIRMNVELDGPTHRYPSRRRFDEQRDEYLKVRRDYLVARIDLTGKSVDEIVALIDRKVRRRVDAIADAEIQALYKRQ